MIHGNVSSLEKESRRRFTTRGLQNTARVVPTIADIYGMFTFEILLRLWTCCRRSLRSHGTTSLDNNDVEKERENGKCTTKDVFLFYNSLAIHPCQRASFLFTKMLFCLVGMRGSAVLRRRNHYFEQNQFTTGL